MGVECCNAITQLDTVVKRPRNRSKTPTSLVEMSFANYGVIFEYQRSERWSFREFGTSEDRRGGVRMTTKSRHPRMDGTTEFQIVQKRTNCTPPAARRRGFGIGLLLVLRPVQNYSTLILSLDNHKFKNP